MNIIFRIIKKLYLMIKINTFFVITGLKFKSIGSNFKFRGYEYIFIGKNVSVGDFCWIEAVYKYNNQQYNPSIQIMDEVAISDFVHISAIKSITIAKGTLIGSKVYIGDHSHGHYKDIKKWKSEKDLMPKMRELADEADIIIGENCWIGDGVVILAGTTIGDNCVIAANSVVKGSYKNNVLIGGLPAKILKEFE